MGYKLYNFFFIHIIELTRYVDDLMLNLHGVLVQLIVLLLGKPNVPQEFGRTLLREGCFLGLGIW